MISGGMTLLIWGGIVISGGMTLLIWGGIVIMVYAIVWRNRR